MTSITLCDVFDVGLDDLHTASPFAEKVHRALALHAVAYGTRREPAPRAYRKLNATGQVPILLVGDRVIPDSTDILAYLRGAYPRPGAVAAEGPEARLLEELADTRLNAFVVAARWADERNWPRVRDRFFGSAPALFRHLVAPRIRASVLETLRAREVWRRSPEDCWRRLGELLDALEGRAPSTGFWFGDTLGGGDLALFGQLASLRTELTPWQAAELRRRDRLSAYVDRVHCATWRPYGSTSNPSRPCDDRTFEATIG